MERKKCLIKQLKEQVDERVPFAINGENIGSMIFWFDDYGAFITFAKWKLDEFPWSFPYENNIDLSEFDVFDYDEMKLIGEAVEAFYEELKTDPAFLSLPLREGFQFCYFDNMVGEPLNGIKNEIDYSLEQAMKVVLDYLNKSIAEHVLTKLEEVTFSSEAMKTTFIFSGEDQYEVSSYPDLDIGFAFTCLMKSAEDNFFMLCEKIVNSSMFVKIAKANDVTFKIFIDAEEFYQVSYQAETEKLVKFDLNFRLQ